MEGLSVGLLVGEALEKIDGNDEGCAEGGKDGTVVGD